MELRRVLKNRRGVYMKIRRFRVEYGSSTQKLLIACIMAGEYPYESLDLINVSRTSILRSMNALINEFGYIAVKKRRDAKKIILKLWERNKEAFAEEVFRGASSYDVELKISKPVQIYRKDRIAELIIMCLEAGVHVTPDEKPLGHSSLAPDDIKAPYLLLSVELRREAPVKEDRGKGARFHGMIVSGGGMYVVYNMGKGLMDWVRPAEYNAIQMMQEYSKKMPWFIEGHIAEGIVPPRLEHSSIVFTRNYMYAVDFVRGKVELPAADSIPAAIPAESYHGGGSASPAGLTSASARKKVQDRKNPGKRRTGKNLFNISEYYDNTYFLPLDYRGQIMLNIMTHSNWHYYLTGLFYPDDERVTPAEAMSIGCDGKNNGNYGLVFLDGNITRLKRFLSVPVTDTTKGHLKIICYDFQYEAVKKLAPGGFDIITYEFETVVQGFYNVYEQYAELDKKDSRTEGL